MNSVYRGHLTTDTTQLSDALKIIMHSNYIHTRSHPQRTHQSLDPLLDDLDENDPELGPLDPERGTGHQLDDFNLLDEVQVWHANTW
ncbi:MAG: hypothetical protein P4M11_09140, partial [Candidatus Pacebacteria bacterium]|nr:hypothetical protein [Candidatus Paceibacterota bacterium]